MATAVLVVLTLGALVVLVLGVGLLVTLGARQLNTPEAIAHDGPPAGRRAPAASLRRLDGAVVEVPSGRAQLLLFADHSLVDFPGLLGLLTDQTADRPDVVVVGSTQRTSAELLSALGLRVPVVLAEHAVYDRYRVRVMPYAVAIRADGRVAGSALVNTPAQLRHLADHGGALDRAEAGRVLAP